MVYRGEIKVNRVKINNYPGMNLYYSDIGVVNVLMIKYLHEFLYKFIKEFRGTSATLSARHLIQIRGEEDDEFLE